jgi:uncharacterized membrane protein
MKTKTSATLVLLLTFLLGSITGAVGFCLYARRAGAAGGRDGGRPSPHHIVEELAQTLALDSSQKERLQSIVTESRERYRTLSEQVRPQYDEIRRQTREQIRQVLREDQKPQLEEFFKELDKRRRNRPPPPEGK